MKKWVVEKRFYQGSESYAMEQETFNSVEEAEEYKEFCEQARVNQPNEFYVVYEEEDNAKCKIIYDVKRGIITYTANNFKYVDTSNNGKEEGFIKLMEHLGQPLSEEDIKVLLNGDVTEIDVLDSVFGEDSYTAIFID